MITVTTSDGEDQYPDATRYIATDQNAIFVFRGDVWIAFYAPGMFSKVVQSDTPGTRVGRCQARVAAWGSDGATRLRCMNFRDHSGLHFWGDA